MKVKDLIARLQGCDLEADVWVTSMEDEDLDPDEMSTVEGIEFNDEDDDVAREVGRKKYGVPYLRVPVLRIAPNK